MGRDHRLLHVSVTIFKVLAWLSLVIQVGLGVSLLVMGGPAVSVGGLDVPARVVGVLNCLAGAIYFFVLSLISAIITLLLEVREQVGRAGHAGSMTA